MNPSFHKSLWTEESFQENWNRKDCGRAYLWVITSILEAQGIPAKNKLWLIRRSFKRIEEVEVWP